MKTFQRIVAGLIFLFCFLLAFAVQAQLRPGIKANGLIFKKATPPDTLTVCVQSSVEFSSEGTNAFNVNWFFGSGIPGQEAGHGPIRVTYNATGINLVKQIVADFNGVKDSMTLIVKVADPDPVISAAFAVNPSIVTCGSNIFTFTPDIINTARFSYTWDFKDEVTSTQPVATHQFLNAPGTGIQDYMVNLVVKDRSGCIARDSQKITVKQVPDISLKNADPNVKQSIFNNLTAFSYCNDSYRAGSFYKFRFINGSSTIATNTNYKITWREGMAGDSSFTSWNGTDTITHNFPFGTSIMVVRTTGPGPDSCYNEKRYNIFVGFKPKASIDVESIEICVGDTAYFPISKYEDDAPGTIYFVKVNDGRPVINFNPRINDIVPIVFDRTSCGRLNNRWEVEFFVQNACNISSVIGTVAVSDKASASMLVSPASTICLSTNLTVKNESEYGSIISGDVASGYVCNATASPLQAWKITPYNGYTITGDTGIFNGTNIVVNGSPQLSITFTRPGTYLITEYVSNGKCSGDSILKTICVRNDPNAVFNLSGMPACNQDTVKFINTSAGENECNGNAYKWNFTLRNDQTGCTNGLAPLYINSKDTSKSPDVWFRGPGIYDVKLITTALNTGLPSCTATKDTTVIIKAPARATINNIPSICSGGSISPSAVVVDCYSDSALTFAWTFENGMPGSSPDSLPRDPVFYNGSGIQIVKLDVKNSCGTTQAVKTFNISKPTAEAGNPKSFCSGGSVVIGENTGNYSYKWSPETGLSNPDIAEPTLTLFNNNVDPVKVKYYVTVSSSADCSAVDSVEIEVKQAPVVSTNLTAAVVCKTDNVTLTASGASTYTWSPDTHLNVITGNSVVSTPVNSIIYTVTGSLSNGCSSSKTINISVIDKPIADAGPLTEICSGSSGIIGTNQGVYDYQWHPVTGLSNSAVDQPTVTLTTTNSINDTILYYVTVSAGAACSVTDSVQVVVKPVPIVTVQSEPRICSGDSILIIASGATNYTCSPAEFLNTATGATVIAKPPASTAYTVTGSLTNGCTDVADFTLIVNPLAVAVFTPSSYENCAPYNLQNVIQVTPFTDENKEYTWMIKDKNGETTQTYNTATPPDYRLENAGDSVSVYLIAVSRYGCKNDTTQTVIFKAGNSVRASFMPDKNNVCEPDTLIFINASSILDTSVNYAWNFGNGNTSNQMQPPRQPYNTSGTYADTFYIVTLTAVNKCSIDSLKDTVYIRARPLARFGVDSTFGCSPLNLTFTNTSLGEPFNYYWNIDNSYVFNTSSMLPFDYSFSSNILDTFHVLLAATNSCGTDTLLLDIVVAPNSIVPKVNTFGSHLFGCAPHTVIFNNSTTGALTADWDFGDGSGIRLPGNQVVVSHDYQQPGIYNIRVDFSNGCSKATDFEQVIVYEKPDAAFTVLPVQNNVTCLGDPVRLNIISQTGDFNKLFWGDEGELFYTTSIVSHQYKKSGTYVIKLVSERLNSNLETTCADTAVQIVKIGDMPVVPKPTADGIITCFNPGAKLYVSGGIGYVWLPDVFLSPGNRVPNPVASPKESTTYRVDIYGASGCVIKDSVKVIVDYTQSAYAVKLPKSFSPNDDQLNDCFGLAGRGMIEQDGSFDFAVYNRWGLQLFHTSDPKICWDGTYKGKPQDPGTYVYTLTYSSICSGNKTKQYDKNYVVLLR